MRRNSCPWEKKAFTKRRKNTRSFFSCPQFRTARIFALWRTLNAGAQQSFCCCLEHHRSLSRTLCLLRTLSFSRSLSIVLFASGSVCACFFFSGRFFLFSFFRWNKECEKWLPSLLVTSFLTELCFIWTPMASLRLSLYTSPWRGRRWFSLLLPVPSLRLAG